MLKRLSIDPEPAIHTRRQFLRNSLMRTGMAGACMWGLKKLFATDDAEAGPQEPRFLLEWGRHGKAHGEFDACIGIAIGPDETVYTAEFRNERVQKFTTEGRFLGSFAVQPHAGGLAVDADGTVYVAHWNSHKVAAYSAGGKLRHEWGSQGEGDGQFRLPGSIALGPDDLLYVPDQGNSRIQIFTRDGTFVGKWGEQGNEPGQFGGNQPRGGRFAGPQFVAFDRAGNVYTTDAALDRVQKFTSKGKLLAHWGSESAEPGGFGPPPSNRDGTPGMGGPISICVDDHDRVWVSSTNNRVQQFGTEGNYLCGIGQEGTGPGQFHLPHGIALDRDHRLYVTDTMNGRIQKFATDEKLQ